MSRVSSNLEADLITFGKFLYEQNKEFGIRPPSKEELKQIASNWLKANEAKIIELIRNNPEIKEAAYSPKARSKQVVGTLIADTLASPLTGGVPCSTLGLLLAHYYLDHILGPPDGKE